MEVLSILLKGRRHRWKQKERDGKGKRERKREKERKMGAGVRLAKVTFIGKNISIGCK